LLLALFVYYAALAFKRGSFVYEDAQQYHGWALALLERGYDFQAFLREVIWVGGDIRMYLSWIALVASFVQAFGEAWAGAIVAMNVLWYCLAAAILLRVVRAIDASQTASPLVIGFLFVLWDYYYWFSHALADSSINLLGIAILALINVAYATDASVKSATLFAIAVVVAGLAVTFKPQGIAILAFVLASIALVPLLRIEDSRALASRMRIGFGLGLALSFVVAYAVGAGAADPSLISDEWLRWMMVGQVQDLGRDGSIVWQRYETYVDPPKTALAYVSIFALRAFSMFMPFARDYSLGHKLVNVVGLIPLYVLTLTGLWSILAGRAEPRAQRLGALAFVLIVSFTMLHALTAIDYDWRYRVPLFGPMLVLAAIGWTEIVARSAAAGPSMASGHPS
jgi:hypothetical protein